MSLGDNHACAGKQTSAKQPHLLRKASALGTQDTVLHEDFPHPETLAWFGPNAMKTSISLLPLVSGTPWTFQRWRPCGLDISTGEDVSGLISHETRDPDRAMSVCHLKPNKEPIHKSPVELMCFAFLIKKWTGRLFAQVACMRHRTWAQGPRVPFPPVCGWGTF